ncbi:MAG: divergent PAP2 family protein [Nanobdellota archaeon]
MLDIFFSDSFLLFVSIILSVIASQFIKQWLSPVPFKLFNRVGGMPSTHASVVGAVLCGILLIQGFSLLFVVAFAFGILVLRDSFGVRFASGENAKLLQSFLPKEKQSQVIIDEGHTPKQLLAGFVLGCAVVLVVGVVFGMGYITGLIV